jgi:hypothetical protein
MRPFFLRNDSIRQLRGQAALTTITLTLVYWASLRCCRVDAAAGQMASLCWHAVIADKDKLAIVIIPQIYNAGARVDSWSAVYYATVSITPDAAGHCPYQLFGPMPAGNNPVINGRIRKVVNQRMHGSFFDEANVSYDLKPNGQLVRWQRTDAGDRIFKRAVFDSTGPRWGDVRTMTVNAKGSKVPSYDERPSNYNAFTAVDNRPQRTGVYDFTADKWVDDPWFTGILAALEEIRGARTVVTDDRNWVFADFYSDWLRDDREDRGKAPVEAAYRGLQFDRRTKILKFHRAETKPEVMDRYERALGPQHAFVDKEGEVWLWYDPVYSQNNEGFSDIVLVSLHGKSSSVLKRANIDYYFLESDTRLFFDASRSTVSAYQGGEPQPVGDGDGTAIPLSFQIFTWSYLDGKEKNLKLDLGNMFQVRDGKVVPKEKQATAVPE